MNDVDAISTIDAMSATDIIIFLDIINIVITLIRLKVVFLLDSNFKIIILLCSKVCIKEKIK